MHLGRIRITPHGNYRSHARIYGREKIRIITNHKLYFVQERRSLYIYMYIMYTHVYILYIHITGQPTPPSLLNPPEIRRPL